jgi:hypothetical protein
MGNLRITEALPVLPIPGFGASIGVDVPNPEG